MTEKNKTTKKQVGKATKKVAKKNPYPKEPKRKFGRPSTFTQEVMNQAEEYLEWCHLHPRDEYENEYDADGKVIKTTKTICLPSHQALAAKLHTRSRQLYKWAEKNDDFGHILEEILELQQQYTLENGIAGVWNSNICKVVLAKHGWKDAVETEHKVDPAIQAALDKINSVLK